MATNCGIAVWIVKYTHAARDLLQVLAANTQWPRLITAPPFPDSGNGNWRTCNGSGKSSLLSLAGMRKCIDRFTMRTHATANDTTLHVYRDRRIRCVSKPTALGACDFVYLVVDHSANSVPKLSVTFRVHAECPSPTKRATTTKHHKNVELEKVPTPISSDALGIYYASK